MIRKQIIKVCKNKSWNSSLIWNKSWKSGWDSSMVSYGFNFKYWKHGLEYCSSWKKKYLSTWI